VLAVAILLVAGCGRLNRTATLNQTKQVAGVGVVTALKQALANRGFPNADVRCAKTMIVNVGTTNSCKVSGAGTKDLVTFTFRNSAGEINAGSVRAR
jgi:hypothetical protein